MNSFSFNDAARFRLVTQQEDTGAKVQVPPKGRPRSPGTCVRPLAKG